MCLEARNISSIYLGFGDILSNVMNFTETMCLDARNISSIYLAFGDVKSNELIKTVCLCAGNMSSIIFLGFENILTNELYRDNVP